MSEEIQADIFNREGDELPYALYDPSVEYNLTWICNRSQQNNIVGVFCAEINGGTERQNYEYTSVAEAKYVRDELVKAGWQKLVPPKIVFRTTEGKEVTNLNREQKRYLARKLKKMKDPQ